MIEGKSIFYTIIDLYEEKKFKEVSKLVKERKIANEDRDNWLFNLACYYNHTSLANALLKIPSISIDGGNISDFIILHEDYIDPLQCAISNNNELLAINTLNRYKKIKDSHIITALENDMYDFILHIAKYASKKNAKKYFKIIKPLYLKHILDNKPEILETFLSKRQDNKLYYHVFYLIENTKLSHTQQEKMKNIFQSLSNYNLELDKRYEFIPHDYALDIAIGLFKNHDIKELPENYENLRIFNTFKTLSKSLIDDFYDKFLNINSHVLLCYLAKEYFSFYASGEKNNFNHFFYSFDLKKHHFLENAHPYDIPKLKECFKQFSKGRFQHKLMSF